MDLPIELRNELEARINSSQIKELIQNTKNLSEKYRNESGNSKRLLTTNAEATAYSLFRMPATYGAVYKALEHTFNLVEDEIHTLLDAGAGTGAASWAVSELLDINNIICLEREKAMIELGADLVKCSSLKGLKKSKWLQRDLVKDNIEEKAELVIASYVLNEMKKDERIKVLEKLWNSTEKILVIIEPGTPMRIQRFNGNKKRINKNRS